MIPLIAFLPLLVGYMLVNLLTALAFPNCKCGRDREFSQGFIPFTLSKRVVMSHNVPHFLGQALGTVPLVAASAYYHDWSTLLVTTAYAANGLWFLWKHEKGKWKRKAAKALGKVKQLANGRLTVVPTPI